MHVIVGWLLTRLILRAVFRKESDLLFALFTLLPYGYGFLTMYSHVTLLATSVGLLLLHLRNDLYCVGWGVKLYSLTHAHIARNSLMRSVR